MSADDMAQVTVGETKRRYADELYPHAQEGEVRPLAVEVPYLYALAAGLRLEGTGWFAAPFRDNHWAAQAVSSRTMLLIEARHKALLADALLQGLTGDEAWTWAKERQDDEGWWAWERAMHYGVKPTEIKPYPCGPEPDHHDHGAEQDLRGWIPVVRVAGKESECAECCEPAKAGDPS